MFSSLGRLVKYCLRVLEKIESATNYVSTNCHFTEYITKPMALWKVTRTFFSLNYVDSNRQDDVDRRLRLLHCFAHRLLTYI